MNIKNIFLYIAIATVLALLISGFSDKNETNNINPQQGFHSNYGIYPVNIPDSITFAGEIVPMQNFDVKESIDRELLINTYWQSQTLIFIKKSNRYLPEIEAILKENGVPSDFKYLAVAESGLMNSTSPSGAKGFWQFLKGTATDYKLEVNDEIDERYHLEKATVAACKYFKEAYAKYGNWAMAAASYNIGRRNLSEQIKRQKSSSYYDLILGEETGRYVYRIIALKLILENPEKYGFYVKPNELYQPIPYTSYTVDTSITNIADFAHNMGTNYKILKELNPWLREATLSNPKSKTYEIKIPEPGFRETSTDYTTPLLDSID